MTELPLPPSAFRLHPSAFRPPPSRFPLLSNSAAMRLRTSLPMARWMCSWWAAEIVGAGVARDAAMRGLRIGLVEQYDLAFGASSRSSRLLHGGLRYLAQGRVRLVHEASREKCILHRIAPHLAEPLPFVFPTYRGTKWPLWQLHVGVKLYDLLCGGRNLGRSNAMSAAEASAHLPGVRLTGLTGAVRYFDGLTNDARLVIDTLRSAARHGRSSATIRGWRPPSRAAACGNATCTMC